MGVHVDRDQLVELQNSTDTSPSRSLLEGAAIIDILTAGERTRLPERRTTMADVVSLRRADKVAVLTIDNPPVNAMSASVRRGLLDQVRALRNDASLEAVVIVCAGRTFIAGAD